MRGVNHYLVELDKPLTDSIKTESGIEFYLEPTYNFSFNVTVQGKIIVVPENKERANEYLKAGDEIAISYSVVNERKFTGQSHIFKIETDATNLKIYYNGNGEHLRITKMPEQIKMNLWVGVYTDKRNKMITGCEGTGSDLEKWLAQFPMSNSKDFVYANLVVINDKYYWKVSKEQIFAKKLKTRLFATGIYAICKPIDVDMSKRVSIVKGIHLADGSIMARYPDRAKLISGGKDYGLKIGDTVSFDKLYVNKYILFGEEYFLIKESRILGIWN